MPRRPAVLIAAIALSVVAGGLLGACGSSGGSSGSSPAPSVTTTAAPATTAPKAKQLSILVGNDDGYSAPGIDVLVAALSKLPNTEVTVFAPLSQQSGTGGKTTDGKLDQTVAQTRSGHPVTAVTGYPADAMRVALDDEGVTPDVVITGINEGQNEGPLVDISGTVGAARAAVARGIPALAASQGVGAEVDFEAAVPFVLAWVKAHRADLIAGTAPVTVTNLNVPSCDTGKVRGLLEVPNDPAGKQALDPQDCTSTTPEAELTTDVTAFLNGYATIDEVPAKPNA